MKNKEHATIRIAADRLRKTLSSLKASGKITAIQAQEIRWFYIHARDNKWTWEQAAAVLSVTPIAAASLFDGRFVGEYSACVDIIKEYHARINAENASDYIETPTWHKIDDFCYAVRSMRSPGFLISASQIGKTAGLVEVKRRDTTDSTLIVRCPAAPSLLAVYAEIARAMHIPYRSKDLINLRYRILDALDDYDLVIFDELHQAFLGTRRAITIRIIESLRALFDYKSLEGRQTGMLFSATEVLDDEMGENGSMHLILDQFRRRGILRLLLPPVPPLEDAHAIAKSFGLSQPKGEALKLINFMLRDSGIGQYIHYLRSAEIMAAGDSEKLNWDHYLAAYDIINEMSWIDPEANVIIKKRR